MASDDVRHAAARVRQIGDDVRLLAGQVLACEGVRWRSTAAAGFRRRLAEEAARVRAVAAALDDAAEALLRHATAVDDVRARAARAGAAVHLPEALAGLGSRVLDAVTPAAIAANPFGSDRSSALRGEVG